MRNRIILKIAIIGITIGIVSFVSLIVPKGGMYYWWACSFVIGLFVAEIIKKL